jgi:hypothetical protein
MSRLYVFYLVMPSWNKYRYRCVVESGWDRAAALLGDSAGITRIDEIENRPATPRFPQGTRFDCDNLGHCGWYRP